MKRTLAVAVMVAVLCSAVSAEVTRQLTAEESTAVAAYITAREQTQREKFSTPESTEEGIQRIFTKNRRPYKICAEYERNKMNIPQWSPGAGTQRWLERPKFPGWNDNGNYTWYPDGPNYQRQLKCQKCGGWVNPDGHDCMQNHPLPLIDQWKFTVELVAKDHNKPQEAMAHLKNALDHGEITEAQWDACMTILDGIVAAVTPAG